LQLIDFKNDCDNDTLLIQVNPVGPTCHKGSDTCWNESNSQNFGFLSQLESVIKAGKKMLMLKILMLLHYLKGINKMAQTGKKMLMLKILMLLHYLKRESIKWLKK